MALLNDAVNKLGVAKMELGFNPAKKTLLTDARSALVSATSASALAVGTVTPTANEAGGTLAAATYKYKVSAVNGNGEGIASAASADATISGSTGRVSLAWTAVAGATAYRVYGRTGGQFRFIAEVTTNAYNDTGAVTPDAARTAPAADTTALSAAKKALAASALRHATFALDCAANDMNGSGGAVTVTSTDKKLNEPYHTAKAFEDALAALSA
jgi:hypothetical protein